MNYNLIIKLTIVALASLFLLTKFIDYSAKNINNNSKN